MKIRMLAGGAGIIYKDAEGRCRHELKTVADGVFECDDEQALRLVDLNVAEMVEKPKYQPEKNNKKGNSKKVEIEEDDDDEMPDLSAVDPE